MFKVSNRNTKTKCEICSNLTIKTPEPRHWDGPRQTQGSANLIFACTVVCARK